MSITKSTYKPLFIIFQVLYKERSVVRKAYIDILYDSRQRRVNFTLKIAYQVNIFFLLCYATIALLLIKPRPRTWDCSMESIPSRTLFQNFQ